MKAGYKQTEVGVIPEDWDANRLGAVVTFQRGFDLPHRSRRRGVVPIISSAGTTDYHDTALVSSPGVVTGRYGTIGEVFYVEEPFWPLNTTLYVRDFHGNDAKFVYYLLQRFDFEIFSGKSGVPGVNRNDLHAEEVVLPTGKSEQSAIATALGDVDALLAAQDALIAKKRAIKQGAMQELLTGKRRLPGFSGEWEACRIGDMAQVKTGPFGSTLHESDYVQVGTPIITVEHLGEFGVTRQNLPLVSDEDCKRLEAYSLRVGDIVFSRVGSVDRNALIRDGECGWLFSGRLLRVRPDRTRAFPPFVSYQFHTEKFRNSVLAVAVGQTMASLNTAILNILVVELPPIAEQSAIASVLSEMDVELTALETQRTKTAQLKQGMMQALLTGRIRLI